MTADTPSPHIDFWPSLCDANLHKKLNLGPGDPIDPAALLTIVGTQTPFPPMVPADFAQHWFEALQTTFGAAVPAGVVASSLNGAYAMTWLMLWFQTSGAILGILDCRPKEPTPPGNCGKDKRSWTRSRRSRMAALPGLRPRTSTRTSTRRPISAA